VNSYVIDNIMDYSFDHDEDIVTKNVSDSKNVTLNFNPFFIVEIVVALTAVAGNFLVIIVFHKDKKLKRRTNYFIISLATADLLVGLIAIPCAILIEDGKVYSKYLCLLSISLVISILSVSKLSIVAISIDRYWVNNKTYIFPR
jgi:adenosine receptor A2a